MIAIDTNILARLLLRDSEDQYEAAVKLLGDGRRFTAPPTVILELVWVLQSYGIDRSSVAGSLKALLGLPNFEPSHAAEIRAAVGFYEAGLDFADALHLALSGGHESFLTFHSRFAKRAGQIGATPTVALA